MSIIGSFINPDLINLYNKLSDDLVDLLKLQNSLNKIKDFRRLDLFIQENWIDYQIKGKKIVNSTFLNKLNEHLNSIELTSINENILKEYYILNDLEYLVFKNKNKLIKSNVYLSLLKSQTENKFFIQYLGTRISNPNFNCNQPLNNQIKDLLIEYNNKTDKIFTHFDDFTNQEMKRKFNENNLDLKNYKLNKTRELKYFTYLFKNFKK